MVRCRLERVQTLLYVAAVVVCVQPAALGPGTNVGSNQNPNNNRSVDLNAILNNVMMDFLQQLKRSTTTTTTPASTLINRGLPPDPPNGQFLQEADAKNSEVQAQAGGKAFYPRNVSSTKPPKRTISESAFTNTSTTLTVPVTMDVESSLVTAATRKLYGSETTRDDPSSSVIFTSAPPLSTETKLLKESILSRPATTATTTWGGDNRNDISNTVAKQTTSRTTENNLLQTSTPISKVLKSNLEISPTTAAVSVKPDISTSSVTEKTSSTVSAVGQTGNITHITPLKTTTTRSNFPLLTKPNNVLSSGIEETPGPKSSSPLRTVCSCEMFVIPILLVVVNGLPT